jgi:uncharacterized protein YbjT (DUF2867 family)
MADKMTQGKLIAVVGATGAQGGGLARAILADPSSGLRVRALTRDPNSAKARALAALGAEVVAMDIDDPASVTKGFMGANAAFCVTFFWEHFSPEKENTHARSMAAAARAAGLDQVIWSTLEDSRAFIPLADDRMPTLMGHYKVPHFDAKGESDRYFEGLPVTYLLTSFYWDNLIHFGMAPKLGPDGRYGFVLPMGDRKLPGIAAEDIGKCALGVLKRPADFVGKRIGIAGEHLSGAEMAAAMTTALGKDVHHVAVSPAAYRGFDFPGAEDLGNMFQFNHDFAEEFGRVRDVAVSRSLNPALLTFAQWLAQHKTQIPIG